MPPVLSAAPSLWSSWPSLVKAHPCVDSSVEIFAVICEANFFQCRPLITPDHICSFESQLPFSLPFLEISNSLLQCSWLLHMSSRDSPSSSSLTQLSSWHHWLIYGWFLSFCIPPYTHQWSSSFSEACTLYHQRTIGGEVHHERVFKLAILGAFSCLEISSAGWGTVAMRSYRPRC